MSQRTKREYVREGDYLAEVNVEMIVDEMGWSPCLTPEGVCKLDNVRQALRADDLESASRLARVYELRPVAS